MLRSATALFTVLTAGWMLFGAPTSASAGHCKACGPIPPTYVHKTIVKHFHVTRNHYKSVTVHVPRVHRIVHVTDIQPITHVHDVWHVTVYKVPVVYDVHEQRVEWLPPKIVHSSETIRRVVCGCDVHRGLLP
jgi:hypothetical protein